MIKRVQHLPSATEGERVYREYFFLVFCVADNFTCNVSVTSTNISKYTNSLRAVCHTVCLLARGTDAVFSGERKE